MAGKITYLFVFFLELGRDGCRQCGGGDEELEDISLSMGLVSSNKPNANKSIKL